MQKTRINFWYKVQNILYNEVSLKKLNRWAIQIKPIFIVGTISFILFYHVINEL